MAKFIEVTAEVWEGSDASSRKWSIAYINVDHIKYYHPLGTEKTKVVLGNGADNFIVVLYYVHDFRELVELAGGDTVILFTEGEGRLP